MNELRSFGTELIGATVIAKHFYRHKCIHSGHEDAKNEDGIISEAPARIVDNEKRITDDRVKSARDCISDLIG